ncbi:sigma-70 family RNA polymerase sigma factor [Crateriforma conspicua]|uniref:RNA polymerase sigma factor n=1 Tax=Crateriforma conspicua TaxID=2527996 RepID=A0A5C5Y0L3_9PLAN|nr:sigma-70 family RNA polymerase sigma factor [Crateriforma conspicua]TWT68750.1 RNA polymerase sigma factor [Crateriforma conspicua]
MRPNAVPSSPPKEAEFMRLFLRHENQLRVYARTMLPDWNSVDDALQEASVTMWQKLWQLENADGFLPWAKVILRFKCLHSIEDLRRRRPILSDEVLTMLADNPDTRIPEQDAEMRSALQQCLSQFTAAHQELLIAPYTAGQRVGELAEQSGKTPNAFYKLLGRLREKLTDCVQRQIHTAQFPS